MPATRHSHGASLKRAQQHVRERGMTLTWSSEFHEYRVNFKGGNETTAYYTNDLDDAVRTAEYMREHHAVQPYTLTGIDTRLQRAIANHWPPNC